MKAYSTPDQAIPAFQPYVLHLHIETRAEHNSMLCLLTTTELTAALKDAGGAAIPALVMDEVISHGNACIRGTFLHELKNRN